ncbi:hypothetical protein IWX49DRAFT_500781 [Phyllosticta citricarpa]|uniref:histidine kinase n=2 Tax=Phyllosticta TaxID=121621 RepID=A0ABR1MKL1_9PEZI
MRPSRHQRPISYFPKAQRIQFRSDSPTVSEPTPYTAWDVENATKPLPEFDEAAHEINYAERRGVDPSGASHYPPRPSNFREKYLMPTLTRNERLRLTMMWYHTRTLADDQELLQKLQTTLTLVRSFVGWPVVVCGLMDNHTYTRICTDGIPKTSLPRKETVCAHTINSESGVLVLPNMLEDWRFKRSPPVEFDGLRAYGGATLRCTTESGESLALGSLCVAADVETQLPPEKQAALVQFADILSAEIVNRSRHARQRERQHMSDVIAHIKGEASPENAEELVLQALKDEYPMARVILYDSDDDTIELDSRESVAFADFEDGLWEDSELLDTLILTRNHEELSSNSTIRAIATHCRKQPHPRFLIVASKEVQLVFDDVDAWFVESAGAILFDFYQAILLHDALKAKELFIRGMTHQLRTPLHGVIASVEMLAEELSSKSVVSFVKGPPGVDNRVDTEFAARASLYLTSIKSAGKELMSTVNNMLMLNRWAESSRSMKPASLHELNELEAAILHAISQIISEDEVASTSILFDNILPVGCGVIIDIALLKEALKALILNAIQATPDGSVRIVISATQDYSVLQFDIYDSGCGISRDSFDRVFEAYEKGDSHSRGVGLGLTIASKIANAMNGYVSLVSSEPGKGSHFRAEFHNPGFACSTSREALEGPRSPALERLYYEVPTGEECSPLVEHLVAYLEHRGYKKSNQSQGALNIVSFAEDESRLRSFIDLVADDAVSICLIPSRARSNRVRLPHHNEQTLFVEGPFLTTKLRETLGKVENLMYNVRQRTPPRSSHQNGSPRMLDELLLFKLRITDPVHALLVDDNAINLRVLRMYCEKRKVPYALAVDGNEAVSQYASNVPATPFNLVLMDLQMPKCDGIEATRKIRALERDWMLAPAVIFIITGQDSPEDKFNSKDAGANDFFVKPMSIKTLDGGIGQYFEQIALP